jgi:hypothetical protein
VLILSPSAAKANDQKFVNDLMHGLYTAQYITSHSLTGAKSSKGVPGKPAMKVEHIQPITGNYMQSIDLVIIFVLIKHIPV